MLKEIVEDFLLEKPMNRMLQGDVGCGKTIVSILASSIVVSKSDREFTFKLKSVMSELYKPVQRENRIMKKSIKLGVTVSGY